MPTEPKTKQTASSLALAAKKGKIPKENLKSGARQMYDSMTAEQLEKFVSAQSSPLSKFSKGRPQRIRRAVSA